VICQSREKKGRIVEKSLELCRGRNRRKETLLDGGIEVVDVGLVVLLVVNLHDLASNEGLQLS
jgi:hypothetical protein